MLSWTLHSEHFPPTRSARLYSWPGVVQESRPSPRHSAHRNRHISPGRTDRSVPVPPHASQVFMSLVYPATARCQAENSETPDLPRSRSRSHTASRDDSSST